MAQLVKNPPTMRVTLPFMAIFLVDSQLLCQIPIWGSLMWGSEPSQQWENFFGIIVLQWVTHLEGMGFDCIVIAPFLPSCCGFVVFGRGVSFIGEFWHPPIDGSSTASCNFGAFAGGDEHTAFYSIILNPDFFF